MTTNRSFRSMLRGMVYSVVSVMAVLGGRAGSAADIDPDWKIYVPRTLTVPADRPYVGPDGSILVAGNDVLNPLFDKINARFLEMHPNLKFTMLMKGSTLSIEGLISEKSALGPIGRWNRRTETDYFVERFGYDPTYLKIGYDHNPNNKLSIGVWVNAKNPIKSMTVEQVTRIFTTGGGDGDITHWRQLGLGGDYSNVSMHVYLMRDFQGLLAMPEGFRNLIGGLPFTPRAEWMPRGEEAINAVGQDEFGIALMDYWNNAAQMGGVTGWSRMKELGPRVKFVPIARNENDVPSPGTKEGSLHPFAGPIGINLNKAPGKPLDPWLKAYCQFLLSKEAQEIMNTPEMRAKGFRPLAIGEAAQELMKLE